MGQSGNHSADQELELCQLVEQARAGDQYAFDELVKRFEGLVHQRALRWLKDIQAAEDVTQEVFLRVWQKLPTLNEAQSFLPWLKKITDNLALNMCRKRGRAQTMDPEIMGELAESMANLRSVPTDLFDTLERDEIKRMVMAGLQKLGELDRQTLEAHYLEERSVKEMSLEFGVPVGTIKRRLHDARRRCCVVVEESGAFVAV